VNWIRRSPASSALEAGLRLIQFTWIDALLGAPSSGSAPSEIIDAPSGSSALQSRLAALRRAILPPHVWFAWRHRSFGSSANNHLLGELAGCIVATVRWPELARCGVPRDRLKRRWEHEVLAQFAEDGGNKEQALNYQLFSWELCWQAYSALQNWKSAAFPVDWRLASAAHFFRVVQSRTEHWDYGDSDNATVVPFFACAEHAVSEWYKWLEAPVQNAAIDYWLGDSRTHFLLTALEVPLKISTFGEWSVLPETGIGICNTGFWWLRWDLSPLGYLSTAAHGHLDALHLSIWFKGVALVVDPGTGAYYADPALRTWLASRAAHNAPCPTGPEQPRRLGPFLWSGHHPRPTVSNESGKPVRVLSLKRRLGPSKWEKHDPVALDSPEVESTVGELPLIGQLLRRAIAPLPDGTGWLVKDECIGKDGRPIEFTVRWQFAPDTNVKRLDARRFLLRRHDVAIELQVSAGWSDVVLVEMDAFAKTSRSETAVPEDYEGKAATAREDARPTGYEGIVSPAFRKTVWAPYLKLVARPPGRPCVFSTTFLASPRA
jgi:hypothetical protein